MRAKASLIGFVFLSSPIAAFADVTKVGVEFQVNAATDGYQRQADVAATADGGFVVVWIGPPETDADPEVMGRLVDGTGALSAEFLVNLNTDERQNRPVVAADAEGNFVVVWTSAERDGDGYGIFGQRFDADATPVGTEFRANTTTADDQRRCAVAGWDDGRFVVVWESTDQDGEDGGIFGQRYDATGAPAGTEFQVNTFTANSQYIPDVGTLTGGGFVVAWGSSGQDDPQDTFSAGTFGQRFAADGAPQGTEFQVNTYTEDTQSNVAIAARTDGGFTMVWEDFEQDPSGNGIFAQRYNASGARLGAELQLDQTETGSQFRPEATSAPDNGFLAIWHDNVLDGDGSGLFVRAFDGDGTAASSELQVNTETVDDQFEPALAAHADGATLAVYRSIHEDFGDILAQGLASAGAPSGVCADPVGASLTAAIPGERPLEVTASDALVVLRAAVGTQDCELCICDVDGSGGIAATDALITLKVAVGQSIELNCPACE